MELASPRYVGFGFFLIINCLSRDRLCAFLFYVELVLPHYLGFGVYLMINLLSPDHLRAVFSGGDRPHQIQLYVDQISPSATFIGESIIFLYHCFSKISVHMQTKTELVIICVT